MRPKIDEVDGKRLVKDIKLKLEEMLSKKVYAVKVCSIITYLSIAFNEFNFVNTIRDSNFTLRLVLFNFYYLDILNSGSWLLRLKNFF